MTAPVAFPTTSALPSNAGQRQFAGRRPQMPQSQGGTGGAQSGMLQQPGQQQPRQNWQTSHPPQSQQTGSAPPPTFAQMQAQGQARPAPQQVQQQQPAPTQAPLSSQGASQAPAQGTDSTLQQSIQQALQNPSAYGSQQVQDSYNMLNQQLGESYKQEQSQLNDELAKRGISDSSIAGQRYSDLATEQARAQSNMATTLATQAAQTYGADRTAAQSAGLGLGNLGVAQQQANTGQQSVQNQFTLGQGNLGLGQQQLAQQGSQFGQSLGLQQQQVTNQSNQFGQSLGLQQQSQDLAKTLGLGNLNQNQQQITNQQNQFGQSFGLQQQAQTASQQEFAQSLAQSLGLATMSDKTQNRGLDIQQQQGGNSLLYQLAMMGIGGTGTGGIAGGALGGAATGSTGTTGTGQAGGPGGTGDGSQTALIEQMMNDPAVQANPQLYAALQDQFAKNMNWGTSTVNFGGQQYTQQQFATLKMQHPELFKATNPGDASNAAFFQANADRTAQTQAQRQAAMTAAQPQAETPTPMPFGVDRSNYSSDAEYQAAVASKQQQFGAPGSSSIDPALDQIRQMTPEQQKALMSQLMQKYSGSSSPGDYGSTVHSAQYNMSPEDSKQYQYLQALQTTDPGMQSYFNDPRYTQGAPTAAAYTGPAHPTGGFADWLGGSSPTQEDYLNYMASLGGN